MLSCAGAKPILRATIVAGPARDVRMTKLPAESVVAPSKVSRRKTSAPTTGAPSFERTVPFNGRAPSVDCAPRLAATNTANTKNRKERDLFITLERTAGLTPGLQLF